MDRDRQDAEKYTWCVIDEFGRLYVAYSEMDAYMVHGTVGGTVYLRGCKYLGGVAIPKTARELEETVARLQRVTPQGQQEGQRLLELENKISQIRSIAVSDRSPQEKVSHIVAKIDGVIGG